MFRNYGFLRISAGKSISKSYGRYIFHFFRNLPPLFPIGCAPVHSPQQCRRVPFLYTALPVRRLLEDGHSACWEAYLVALLVCISLLISYAEQVFTCFFFFFFNSESEIFVLKLTSWKSTPLNSFLITSTGIFLMGKCHLQCPSPCDY